MHNATIFSRALRQNMMRMSAIFFMACTCTAQATAPRIAPQMFEEHKADIVGYQFEPIGAATTTDTDLAVEIVTEAFKAAGKTPSIDVLPSKQLAIYALLNKDALALMGTPQDLTAQERNQCSMVTFYLGNIASGEKAFSLIFSKARGNGLHQAFNEGMQKIIKSGKYIELLESHYGKGKVPADYLSRVKSRNPRWK